MMTPELRQMLDTLDANPAGLRDRALLLLGFSGAFRRSELVGLDVADIESATNGCVVILRRSKTDQDGQGMKKGIPYGSSADSCPVRAVQAWLSAAGIQEGPIFRPINRHGQVRQQRMSDKAVALIVQRVAAASGLDPALYAGHSLRAGMATQAALSGATERSIMKQTGHRSVSMVRRYIRDGNLFNENAASRLGL